jgi:hypothetical protein
MSSLTPEVRVDKNGRAVTKHVRTEKKQSGGFLARIMPTLNGSAGKQKDSDLAVLNEEIKHAISSGASPKSNEELLIKIIKGYSPRTVASIKDAFSGTGQLVDFVERTYMQSQSDTRTSARFKDLLVYKEFHAASILDSVRDSIGVYNLDEIPEGTDEYITAKAVLEVAVKACSTQSSEYDERAEAARAKGFPRSEAHDIALKEMKRDGSDAFMTPELAQMISEIPERASDIAYYLLDKESSTTRVDLELLRMYLNSDTPAIADGML